MPELCFFYKLISCFHSFHKLFVKSCLHCTYRLLPHTPLPCRNYQPLRRSGSIGSREDVAVFATFMPLVALLVAFYSLRSLCSFSLTRISVSLSESALKTQLHTTLFLAL